jgi:(2R)-ethylmalonyl-CoA mutase
VTAIEEWRTQRDAAAVERSLAVLKERAQTTENLFEATVDCARAGVTTGEWSGALREVFGEYRAPTGVSASAAGGGDPGIERVRERVRATEAELGERLRILVGKPGLDGHSNGAEQVAVRARDVGFEVVYQGIRLTPEQIVAAAVQEGVHVVGLSVLSGSHLEVVPHVVDGLRAAGAGDVPVIVGGIIPPDDAALLTERGIARVFTPKDYELTGIMDGIVSLIRERHDLS